MKFALRGLCAALLATLVVGSANAQEISDRATFESTIVGEIKETFDLDPSGTIILNGGLYNGVTYAVTGAQDLVITDGFLPLTPPNGLGATDLGFFLGTDSVTFSFAAPVSAFGISINTFATAYGDYTLSTNGGDTANSYFDPFPVGGTGQFVGLSGSPFTSVTLSAPGGIAYTLDDLMYLPAATDVPEPGSVALLGGLACVGGLALRRRARK